MPTALEPRTVLPPREQQNFADLLEALSSAGAAIYGRTGHAVPLPEEVRDAFLNVAVAMSEGKGIRLVPHRMTLTTQEAADILNISRPTLVKLLEEGRIPHEKPGRHRKIRLDALLQYQQETRIRRAAALQEATRDSADEIRALLRKKG
ncbi:MAG: helix-turn-helix domain-containing protein [Mycobacteriaceae bacterium]|nr:helix-turn-helix domain-containing protein [Mycobacteriaceae bacterium]